MVSSHVFQLSKALQWEMWITSSINLSMLNFITFHILQIIIWSFNCLCTYFRLNRPIQNKNSQPQQKNKNVFLNGIYILLHLTRENASHENVRQVLFRNDNPNEKYGSWKKCTWSQTYWNVNTNLSFPMCTVSNITFWHHFYTIYWF